MNSKFTFKVFNKQEVDFGKTEIKDLLKTLFAEHEMVQLGKRKVAMPKSTSEYDFKTYTAFLNDINAWCIECFSCELPLAEDVD